MLPGISDAVRRRKPVILIGLFLAVPATLGLVLADFVFEIVSFFVMGFCITGLTPVAYQYGAEITIRLPKARATVSSPSSSRPRDC